MGCLTQVPSCKNPKSVQIWMVRAWLRAGLAWTWAAVKRQYLLAKSPLGQGPKEKGWKMERMELCPCPPTKNTRTAGGKFCQGSRGLEKGGSCFVQEEGPRKALRCSWQLHGCEISPWKIFFLESASPKMPFLPTHEQVSFQTGSSHQLKVCGGSSEI